MSSILKDNRLSQKGFTYPVIFLVVFGVIGVLILVNLPVKNSYPSKNNSNIQGVLLAKEGSDSVSSGSDSHDSGSSGSSSSGSPSSESSGSGSSSSSSGGDSGKLPTTANPTNKPTVTNQGTSIKIDDKNKLELKEKEKRLEVEIENELENEVENELAKANVKEIEFKNIAGKIEIEVKQATGSAHKLKAEIKNLTLNLTKNKGEREVELKIEDNKFKFESKGQEAETEFPLTLDAAGQLLVKTPNGLKVIRVLPDLAASIAKNAGVANQIEKIELRENLANPNDNLVFKIAGRKTGKILGIIPVSGKVETEIGAQTGSVLTVVQPLFLKILSLFI